MAAVATSAVTLPALLQELADLPTHHARTQRVLNDLVVPDAGERYDEGIDAEAEETYHEPERTQSAFRNFCDWCKAHCAQLQPYSNNWELAAETAPEGSLWRKNVEAYRDFLWKTKPGKPFAEFCSTRDTVMTGSVFWPWVARTWRDAPQDLKDAFIAAASIRALAVAATWVEHLWDVDHPQCEAIRAGDIQPAKANIECTNFGQTKLVGPLNPDHLVHKGTRPYEFTLAGWHIPIYIKNPKTAPQFYFYDRFDRVLFRIWVPFDRTVLLTSLLRPLPTTPLRSRAGPPQVRRKPALPVMRCFSDDLLDSIAARHGGRTDLATIVDCIYDLRRDGFIGSEADEDAFIAEYRAFCRRD
jgi:hypothetical protein